MTTRRFVWDVDKARTNRAKHGVGFELAELVWSDPLHIVVPDRLEDGEQRWHAIGAVGPQADETLIRIIGVRKATAGERKRYEEDAWL